VRNLVSYFDGRSLLRSVWKQSSEENIWTSSLSAGKILKSVLRWARHLDTLDDTRNIPVCSLGRLRTREDSIKKYLRPSHVVHVGEDNVSELQPTLGLLFVPQMTDDIYEYGKPRCNYIDRGNRITRIIASLAATLSTSNPVSTDPSANPGLCCDRPATDSQWPTHYPG
jgi:hypothetical protein